MKNGPRYSVTEVVVSLFQFFSSVENGPKYSGTVVVVFIALFFNISCWKMVLHILLLKVFPYFIFPCCHPFTLSMIPNVSYHLILLSSFRKYV